MSRNRNSSLTTIDLIYVEGRGKSAVFEDENENEVSFPRLLIEFDDENTEGQVVAVDVPEWLVIDRGLA